MSREQLSVTLLSVLALEFKALVLVLTLEVTFLVLASLQAKALTPSLEES